MFELLKEQPQKYKMFNLMSHEALGRTFTWRGCGVLCHALGSVSHCGSFGSSVFPPRPPSLFFLVIPSIQRIIFQTAPVLCPAVRLFSLVLVTLSDCSRISSQVSLLSAITTLFFKQIHTFEP